MSGRVGADGSVGLNVSNGAASGAGTGRLQARTGGGTWKVAVPVLRPLDGAAQHDAHRPGGVTHRIRSAAASQVRASSRRARSNTLI